MKTHVRKQQNNLKDQKNEKRQKCFNFFNVGRTLFIYIRKVMGAAFCNVYKCNVMTFYSL